MNNIPPTQSSPVSFLRYGESLSQEDLALSMDAISNALHYLSEKIQAGNVNQDIGTLSQFPHVISGYIAAAITLLEENNYPVPSPVPSPDQEGNYKIEDLENFASECLENIPESLLRIASHTQISDFFYKICAGVNSEAEDSSENARIGKEATAIEILRAIASPSSPIITRARIYKTLSVLDRLEYAQSPFQEKSGGIVESGQYENFALLDPLLHDAVKVLGYAGIQTKQEETAKKGKKNGAVHRDLHTLETFYRETPEEAFLLIADQLEGHRIQAESIAKGMDIPLHTASVIVTERSKLVDRFPKEIKLIPDYKIEQAIKKKSEKISVANSRLESAKEEISHALQQYNQMIDEDIKKYLDFLDCRLILCQSLLDKAVEKMSDFLNLPLDEVLAKGMSEDWVAAEIRKRPELIGKIQLKLKSQLTTELLPHYSKIIEADGNTFALHLIGGKKGPPTLVISNSKACSEGAYKRYYYSISDHSVKPVAFLEFINPPSDDVWNEILLHLELQEKVAGIPRIIDAGKKAILMENLDTSVEKKFLMNEPPNKQQIARIGSGIAAILENIHQLGKVHFDVKPQNILLNINQENSCEFNDIKLCDLGLMQEMETDATGPGGRIIGTLLYMAPEMIRRCQSTLPQVLLTGKTDIYSLGVSLFELKHQHHFLIHTEQLMGKNEHKFSVIEQAEREIEEWQKTDPSNFDSLRNLYCERAGCSVDDFDSLDEIILQTLMSDPLLRPNAEELKERLDHYLESEELAADLEEWHQRRLNMNFKDDNSFHESTESSSAEHSRSHSLFISLEKKFQTI